MSQVFIPCSIEEACLMLSVPGRMACAGATNLYVDRYFGKYLDTDIVSLHRLDVLKTISFEEDGCHIGACCTFDQLEAAFGKDSDLAEDFSFLSALAEASSLVGGPQVRNRGTIGGNIVSASPSADTVPVLMALDAHLYLQSVSGTRVLPIREFMTGVKKTAIHSDELLTEIIIPAHQGKTAFKKIGKRNALAIAICNVCVYASPSMDGQTISELAIAIGSCGPTCLRAEEVEKALAGYSKPASQMEWFELKRLIADTLPLSICPIDDVRATASYRQKVAANVVYELIRSLWEGQE